MYLQYEHIIKNVDFFMADFNVLNWVDIKRNKGLTGWSILIFFSSLEEKGKSTKGIDYLKMAFKLIWSK